jgi:hypothetical protein
MTGSIYAQSISTAALLALIFKQPIPDDTTTTMDFDMYQYTNYQPTTRYIEFGEVVVFQYCNILNQAHGFVGLMDVIG